MTRTPANEMAEHPSASAEALKVGLGVFAVYNLALAVFMALAPHAFYKAVGPFGAFNAHYLRDVATFSAALGLAFAGVAAPPVLARARARRHDRAVRPAHRQPPVRHRQRPPAVDRLLRLRLAAGGDAAAGLAVADRGAPGRDV